MEPTWQTQDGQIRLYRGDCLDVLPAIKAGSLGGVVTDPPYFLPATHYSVRTGSIRSLSDLSILEHFFRSVFAECRRALGENGTLYSFCDGQSYPVMYATAYQYFKKLRPLVWDKLTAFNGYTWRHQHELILFAECDESKAVPTGDGDILRMRAVAIDDREHLAEKPVELLAQLVVKTAPDSRIIDPFMGSGSTAIACIHKDRPFTGIEKEPRYFDMSVARIEAERSRAPLFDLPAVQQTLELT